MMAPMTITEFLLARIAEDEALADRSIQIGDKGAALIAFGAPDAPLTLVMHPARVLAECEAKRRIVAGYLRSCRAVGDGLSAPERRTVQALAAVYADHPDYRDEWAP